jgi:hypothetical protein
MALPIWGEQSHQAHSHLLIALTALKVKEYLLSHSFCNLDYDTVIMHKSGWTNKLLAGFIVALLRGYRGNAQIQVRFATETISNQLGFLIVSSRMLLVHPPLVGPVIP